MAMLQEEDRVQQWTQHLQYFVFETVGRLRISEMFDIVVRCLIHSLVQRCAV